MAQALAGVYTASFWNTSQPAVVRYDSMPQMVAQNNENTFSTSLARYQMSPVSSTGRYSFLANAQGADWLSMLTLDEGQVTG